MALDVAHCERMISAAQQNGVRLGVAYYRHHYPVVVAPPGYRHLRRARSAGACGGGGVRAIRSAVRSPARVAAQEGTRGRRPDGRLRLSSNRGAARSARTCRACPWLHGERSLQGSRSRGHVHGTSRLRKRRTGRRNGYPRRIRAPRPPVDLRHRKAPRTSTSSTAASSASSRRTAWTRSRIRRTQTSISRSSRTSWPRSARLVSRRSPDRSVWRWRGSSNRHLSAAMIAAVTLSRRRAP